MTQVPDRDPLLETKLHVPKGARSLVRRQRLRERLSAGAGSALTLVSAPAGFGKTTLLTEWLAAVHGDRPSAGWLSLDEADNDPSLFWKYVVAALRSVAGKEVGAGALSLLESSQAPIDAVLTALINDLFAGSEDVILVLDDYHVIEAPEVHDGVVFLLEHLPPRMHVVIASRADPPFSLARWRGEGGLTEIRAADLRFTAEESATYLYGAVGGVLTAQDVATLDQRTEGWIAALQLAALSMQGRDDLRSFIAGFAGDDRYIVDYLVEEVLQRQSGDVRQFLLQSSILDRLSGPLCDAVTGQEGQRGHSRSRWSGRIFSWSRWMSAVAGIAITISSPTCCGRTCWTNSPTTSPPCTAGQAAGSSGAVNRLKRSVMRSPLRISTGRRTWPSWRSERWLGRGRRRRCVVG